MVALADHLEKNPLNLGQYESIVEKHRDIGLDTHSGPVIAGVIDSNPELKQLVKELQTTPEGMPIHAQLEKVVEYVFCLFKEALLTLNAYKH